MLERMLAQRDRPEPYLFAVIILLVLLLAATTDSFFTVQNLFDLLVSYSFIGVLAAGLLVVLISGGIDISFTAIASVAQYVAVSYIVAYDGTWATVFGIAALVGIALGAVNAILIYTLSISPIIVTIATLNIFFGVLIFVTGGDYIYAFPDWYNRGVNLLEFHDAAGNTYAVSIQITVLLLVFAATYLLLNRTGLGRQIYALGGNVEAAKRLGLHVFGLHLFVYCYMGMLAGLASVLQAQLAQSVAPTVLVGKELDVVAATVLGGASLAGGIGSVPGTILGIALLAIMQNGLILIGVSSYWSQVFVGAVILISVTLMAYTGRVRMRKVLVPAIAER